MRQGHSQDEIFPFSKLMSCHYSGRLSINNTYKICYVRKKEEKWILLKGDEMVTEWHWMSTEWSLKCTWHSVDWVVTEISLNGAFQFSQNGGISSCAYFLYGYHENEKFKPVTNLWVGLFQLKCKKVTHFFKILILRFLFSWLDIPYESDKPQYLYNSFKESLNNWVISKDLW